MSLYQKLAREARESGSYAAPGKAAEDAGQDDAEILRERIRSKMEWIAAREEFAALQGRAQDPSQEKTMRLAPYVKFREEKFGGVLFETRSERVYTLSPSGAAVVKEIAAGGGDVVAALKERFEDKDGSLAREASEFIASLREKGLITE